VHYASCGRGGNLFRGLMDAARVCLLGQVTDAFFEAAVSNGAASESTTWAECALPAACRPRRPNSLV